MNPLVPPALKTVAHSPGKGKLIAGSSKNESGAGGFLDYTLFLARAISLSNMPVCKTETRGACNSLGWEWRRLESEGSAEWS